MRLTVIGSADASNSAGRGHSCYWLDGAGPPGAPDDAGAPQGVMIDFGGTALQGLKRLGRGPAGLGTLLITHLHGDHIGGFPYLFVDALFGPPPRSAPLRIVGPLGLEERLRAYMNVAYGSLAEREPGFEVTWRELAPGEAAEVGGVRVEAFPADHMDAPERPLCLRVTSASGRVAAFSGDTQMCDGLRRAAAGADLLVAECTALVPPTGRHISWEDWKVELPRIGARRVLLSHLGEAMRAEVPTLLRTAPPGVELAFADDGLVVEV